jgi:hypothetical protein
LRILVEIELSQRDVSILASAKTCALLAGFGHLWPAAGTVSGTAHATLSGLPHRSVTRFTRAL